MTTSIFHFGLSAWAIYAVVGLAVAYAIHRKGRSVSLRWTLSSVLGEHATGKAGDAIDIVATVATLIGVATSLGFGVMQLSSGVEYLTGIELSKSQVITIAVAISALAAISVSSGLDRGIKFLSDANLVMAAVFAVMVALLGPTLFVLNGIVQDVGDYLARMPSLMMQTLPFGGQEGSDWMGAWTVYYWAWWISWSPFVGIFIARISRGRTVREFVMGVVLVPTLVTLIWFGVMGGTSLYHQIFGGVQFIGADGAVDASRALFQMLDNLPASKILSGAALIILIVFFVTSSDSGSYVMSMLTTGGNTTPPMSVRLLWAILTGAVTASLLAAGGEGLQGTAALQTLVIMVALPMSVLMICMGVALWRDLSVEHEWIVRRERRLLRSRLVEDTVAAVAEQMDDSVRSTGRVEPISLPEPLWAWPIRKQGKPFPPLMLPKIIGKDSKDAGDGEPDDKGAQ